MLFNNRGCCQNQNMMPNMCCKQRPIIEPTITKCIEENFYHEVPHVCPIHTHKINKHFYKHTYTPQYTCSEEQQVVNIDCGSCAQFQ